MPGQRAGQKHRNHLAVSAEERNLKEISDILNGKRETPVVFARVEQNLGAYFRVKIHDGKTLRDAQASPRGLFRQRKAHMIFHAGEIVALEGSIDQSMTDLERSCKTALIYEIVAKLSKKDAQQLFRRGLIHRSVYQKQDDSGEMDDLFDYEGHEEEEEEFSEDEKEAARGGRGSGGKKKQAGGGVGAAGTAKARVKEEMDATEFANEDAAKEGYTGEEDYAGMAEGLGVSKSNALDWNTPVPGSAEAVAEAEAAAAAATGMALYEESENQGNAQELEEDLHAWKKEQTKVKDRWDDSDSDLDIDAI